MRCQFNEQVVATCLCPNVTSTEPAGMCNFSKYNVSIGERNYSDPQYRWKLNMMIHKPIENSCYEDAECDLGLYCKCDGSENVTGICLPCLYSQTCEKKLSLELSNWATCGDNKFPDYCVGLDGKCHTTDPKLGIFCRGLKWNEKGHCVNDTCKKNGTCIDDHDCCPKHGCVNGKVVYAEGQECTATDNRASPNCTNGNICNVETKTCYRPDPTKSWPKIIYNPYYNIPCYEHYECDVGLYCKAYYRDGRGRCEACKRDDVCPEKITPNERVCKRGSHNCPATCVGLDSIHVF